MASSILSKRPDLYQSVADWNSYSKPNESRKARSRALLAAPNDRMLVAERIGHRGQRLAEMCRQHLLVRHVVGHLAQPVHVVGEAEQPRRHVGQPLERLAHHGRAHDLAEGADMRQAGRAVAGLEQHIALGRRFAADAGDQLAGFFERPRARGFGKGTINLGHGGPETKSFARPMPPDQTARQP